MATATITTLPVFPQPAPTPSEGEVVLCLSYVEAAFLRVLVGCVGGHAGYWAKALALEINAGLKGAGVVLLPQCFPATLTLGPMTPNAFRCAVADAFSNAQAES